jgi:tetratricopeptide (TPR) repeat protein
MIQKPDSTQPSTPIKSKKRGRSFLINSLILIAVLAVASFGGYQSGINIRKNNEKSVVAAQLTEQFQYAEQDIQAGRYEVARQRLQWILSQDPSFPGAQEKLTEVLVQINVQQGLQSPTPSPTMTTTPDFSGAEEAFTLASQLITVQDWIGALRALDELRKLDPGYNQSQVDGMYYFAFRNYGVQLINEGNLEGGIYQLTLAERFGPLDRDANGLREGARVYIIGASFWELDWEQAVFYFTQARAWGNLWDGTMTSSQRYWYASMRYGDELFAKGKICEENEALVQYNNAISIAPLDKVSAANYNEAIELCFPATPTLDLTPSLTPTPDGISTTEVPTNTPEPPTETPSETPTP